MIAQSRSHQGVETPGALLQGILDSMISKSPNSPNRPVIIYFIDGEIVSSAKK